MPDPRHQLPPLWKMPLSAPRWVWAAYLLLIACMAVLAIMGGAFGLFAIVATTVFSFQFWTFACWRGMVRRGA
jgi:hypothetical protein